MSDEFIGLVDTLHKSVCASAPVSCVSVCVWVDLPRTGIQVEVEFILNLYVLLCVFV